jgi:transcriptional regulator with XRE-family HTH domain
MGSRIRDRRIELGLSADDLANRLGKNRATIYRYESDEIGSFPVQVIGPLAEVLQVSPAYLMGWEDEKEPTAKNSSGLVSSEDLELADLILSLSPERKQEALRYLRYLAESEEK